MKRKIKWSKILMFFGIFIGIIIIGAIILFFVGKIICYNYFNKWGDKLVDLEKRGLLSKTYGAGWQDVLSEKAMNIAASSITESQNKTTKGDDSIEVVDGIVLTDYPSLSIINKLKEVKTYSNIIEITDRRDRPIVSIKTDHRRVRIEEIPEVLKTALIAAEDKNFRTNNIGFEYESFVRAILQATFKSIISFKKVSPKGTSTITQQVAKLFLSKLDEQGFRRVSKSLDRKIRELRIATALRKMFSPDDILEVYCNHCVTSDYGMIGYADIAAGLFGKELSDLTDVECIYLARMVKWGRNVPSKIIRQCHIDMPRMGAALGWNEEKQKQILDALDTIKFSKPTRFQGSHGLLVDLANEFWQLVLAKNNIPKKQIEEMNLINPNSLIRKKGNLRIKLTIDLPLQKALEELVNKRGYGPDTTIIDDVRVGSRGETVNLNYKPIDTLRFMEILSEPLDFNEPGSAFITSLNTGDTIYKNIRYKKMGGNKYRRSVFFYVRRPVVVNGQYYAYAIMNSNTGKLLAYYSKDRIGSRLACLLKNRTPNGSSTIKPILNALNFDFGIFSPNSKWSDTLEVTEELPWKRVFDYKKGKPVGVIFAHSAVKGIGYTVHNHNDIFEGCQYIFDLLSTSNNILGVETIYRLNKNLFTLDGDIPSDAFPLVQFFSRIGAFSRVKDSLRLNYVTGVRVIKELARIVGVNIDSITSIGERIPLSDSMYSVALGALEMTLYEQLHLFNALYNNNIIEKPAEHPSLVIESIILNGDTVPIIDTIKRYHPFSDINSLRPSWLGMHLRLVGNKADGIYDYDIPYPEDTLNKNFLTEITDTFSPEVFTVDNPMSNFAKSGTTDDIIRPFNADASSDKRTNYGLWNAVLRLELSKFTNDITEPEIEDITIACIGECNEKFTGPRDGKSLHKFITIGLLKKAGIKCENGFFRNYEKYLRSVKPDEKYCSMQNESFSSSEEISPLIFPNKSSVSNPDFVGD